MERRNGLAELTLVSKYYPVANYSYPRYEGAPTPCNSRRSSNNLNDRSSLGSEGSSPPGLIDDRTDSEASGDDDYQYHAHASELWDTFWHHDHDEQKKAPEISPKKQYPALVPSSQRMKGYPQGPGRQQSEAWPLPDGQPEQQRKPTPKYSPFPKQVVIPPRTCSRQPFNLQRPDSCEKGFLAPQPQHLTHLTVPRSIPSTYHQPRSPRAQRPATSHGSRSTSPMDRKPPSPTDRPIPSIHSGASRSATHLPLPGQAQPQKAKTAPAPSQPEPHSVFEYDDSDSDCDGSSPTLSFFRFHKRGESDQNNRRRRSAAKAAAQSSVNAATAAQQRRRRPTRSSAGVSSSPPLRQSDVLSRMLGRRSR